VGSVIARCGHTSRIVVTRGEDFDHVIKKLQRYILRDILKAFVPAFMTLVVIMAVGFCLQLLHDGLDIVRLHALLPPLISYCVPMVLPAAFLTAVIMSFGRLSADNELLAIQAGGVNLIRVIWPVLGLAVLLSLTSAFFQFETVPRAQGKIKVLKYDALEQIVLDKVALSASRQFSFEERNGSVLIKYADFRDGKMKDLVAVHVWNSQPALVIRAESGTISRDPSRGDGGILLEAHNCKFVTFGVGPYPNRGPGTAESCSIYLPGKPDSEKVLGKERYLTGARLFGRLKELQRRVAQQPQLEDAERENERLRAELRKKRGEMARLAKALKAKQADLERYSKQKPQLLEQTVQSSLARADELNKALQEYQQERMDIQRQITEQGLDSADYNRLATLQRRKKALDGQIQAARQEIEELYHTVDEARAQMRAYARRAGELAQNVRVLETQIAAMSQDAKDLRERQHEAEDQEKLRKLLLRLHKRLAQAFSVFVFALLGIPMGALIGGRGVMVAFGMSFAVLLMVFYPLLILGQMAAEVGALPIAPAIWGGNVLTLLLGAGLLWKLVRR